MWVGTQRRQQALVAARVRAVVAAHAEARSTVGDGGPSALGSVLGRSVEHGPVEGEPTERGPAERRLVDARVSGVAYGSVSAVEMDDGFLGLSTDELERLFAAEEVAEPTLAHGPAAPIRWPIQPGHTAPLVSTGHLEVAEPVPAGTPSAPIRPPVRPAQEAPVVPAKHALAARSTPDDAASPSFLARLLNGRPVHAAPGRRGALAVGCAALVAAVITGWWVFSSQPEALPAAAGGGASAAPNPPDLTATSLAATSTAPSAAGSSATSGQLLVDVEGKVRRPGLYRLPNGARVADALTAAGGVRPHVPTMSLNLAARVTDGQQVVVGSAGSPAAQGSPAPGGGTTSSTAPALVSLNAASLEQLETLPGVGPVLAQHILDWRAEHGGFASVDQLNDVSGIGDITFANLHDLVTL